MLTSIKNLSPVMQMGLLVLAVLLVASVAVALLQRWRSEPFVLIANHSSHLDTISLLSLFPLSRLRLIRPVAAADYFERNAFVSLFTKTLFNILPIARKGITSENNPLRRMREALEAGELADCFPRRNARVRRADRKFSIGCRPSDRADARAADSADLPREHG